jgi:hypothetical protein
LNCSVEDNKKAARRRLIKMSPGSSPGQRFS